MVVHRGLDTGSFLVKILDICLCLCVCCIPAKSLGKDDARTRSAAKAEGADRGAGHHHRPAPRGEGADPGRRPAATFALGAVLRRPVPGRSIRECGSPCDARETPVRAAKASEAGQPGGRESTAAHFARGACAVGCRVVAIRRSRGSRS